jgi:hypothetical protein
VKYIWSERVKLLANNIARASTAFIDSMRGRISDCRPHIPDQWTWANCSGLATRTNCTWFPWYGCRVTFRGEKCPTGF